MNLLKFVMVLLERVKNHLVKYSSEFNVLIKNKKYRAGK